MYRSGGAIYRVSVLVLFFSVWVCPAAAQENGNLPVPQEGIPTNEEAELIFEQALEAFEAENYGMAYRRFRLVERDYRLHRKTTAALLMAGKALYRQGNFERAETVLNELIEQYSTSRYLDEARRVRSFARQQQAPASPVEEAFRLGIILPAPDGERAAQTQALFNGFRIAVDEMNGAAEAQPVRMVFRSSGGSADEARQAAEALVREEVDAIVGPLFSEQAIAAARVAERAETVLLAPLATDEAVSENRRYVFQANPTFAVRGRQMANLTARSLITVDSVAVVTERGSGPSEAMAEAFRGEMLRQGRQLSFYKQLSGSQGWFSLASQLNAENVQNVDALYLPLAGSDADQRAIAALQGVDEISDRVRILGNSTWHDLPTKQLASQHDVTYAQPFYVEEQQSAVRSFGKRYRELAGRAPDRLAYTGYDVMRFLLTRQRAHSQEALSTALHAPGTYEGLGLRIDFEDTNVNKATFFLRYRSGRIELLR